MIEASHGELTDGGVHIDIYFFTGCLKLWFETESISPPDIGEL